MEHDNENGRKEKMDSFWDISRLIPAQKETEPIIRRGKPVNLTEVAFDMKEAADKADSTENKTLHFTSGGNPRQPEAAARPVVYDDLSPLIRRVEIVPWKSSYNYYEFFCKNAASYHEIHGKVCPKVSFFSYVAQYSQMNQKQLSWYFWWRENVRNSVYLETDISYIYLYIYEIINLAGQIDTQIGLNTLIGLWAHYRNTYPQLDNSLGEWVCDYSLLHKIPISFPNPLIRHDMITHCSLREVYYTFDQTDHRTLAKLLLYDCNGYDYRKSKFYQDGVKELYDSQILSCLAQTIGGLPPLFRSEDKAGWRHSSRVAFMGALCSYRVRKHIEVDYIPFWGNGEIRCLVTDIVKYSENKLRAYLGIRSRLGIHELPQNMKEKIDRYFSLQFPGKMPDAEPEYEKLYEGEQDTFSLEKALDIERNSWNVTEKLIESFEDNVSNDTISVDTESIATQDTIQSIEKAKSEATLSNEVEEGDEVSAFLSEIAEFQPFFEAVLREDFPAQRAFCKEKGIIPESVADTINEKAADILGDIVIEETENGFRLIEDYRELFPMEV